MLQGLIPSQFFRRIDSLPNFAKAILRGDDTEMNRILRLPVEEQKQAINAAAAACQIPSPLFGLAIENVELFKGIFKLYTPQEQRDLINLITKYTNIDSGKTLLMISLEAANAEVTQMIFDLFMRQPILRSRGKLKDYQQMSLISHAILSKTFSHFQLIEKLIGQEECNNQLAEKDLYQRNALMTALYVDDISILHQVFGILTEEQQALQLTETDSNGNNALMLALLDPALADISRNPRLLSHPARASREFDQAKFIHTLNLYSMPILNSEIKRKNKDGDNLLMLAGKMNHPALYALLEAYSFSLSELREAYNVSVGQNREILEEVLTIKTYLEGNEDEQAQVPPFAEYLSNHMAQLQAHSIFDLKLADGKQPIEHAIHSNNMQLLLAMIDNNIDTSPLVEIAFNDKNKTRTLLSNLMIEGIPLINLIREDEQAMFLVNIATYLRPLYEYKNTDIPVDDWLQTFDYLSDFGRSVLAAKAAEAANPNALVELLIRAGNGYNVGFFNYLLNLSVVQNKMSPSVLIDCVQRLTDADNDERVLQILDIPKFSKLISHNSNAYFSNLLQGAEFNHMHDEIINRLLQIENVQKDIKLSDLDASPERFKERIAPHISLYGVKFIEHFEPDAYREVISSDPRDGIRRDLQNNIQNYYRNYLANHGITPFNETILHILRIKQENAKVKRFELVEAENTETAMSRRAIDAANIGYQRAQEIYQVEFNAKGLNDHERIVTIEQDIRRTILEQIESELTGADEATRTFIENNRAQLIQAIDPNLMLQARNNFFNTNSPGHTAWRAYDQNAPCVQWPNLLTTDWDCRRRVAFYHLGLQDDAVKMNSYMSFEDRRSIFVNTIAEIRRAHNDRGGVDNPSCQPGTVGRSGKMGVGHPQLQIVDPIELIPSIIQRVLTQRIQRFFERAHLTDEEKAEYVLALIYLDENYMVDILAKRLPHLDDMYGNEISIVRLSTLRSQILDLLNFNAEIEVLGPYGNIRISEVEHLVNQDIATRDNPRVRQIAMYPPEGERSYIHRQAIDLSLNGVAQNIADMVRPEILDERDDMEIVDPLMPFNLAGKEAEIRRVEESANMHPALKNATLARHRRALETMRHQTQYFNIILPIMQNEEKFRVLTPEMITFFTKMYVLEVFGSDEDLDKENVDIHLEPLRGAYERFRNTKEFTRVPELEHNIGDLVESMKNSLVRGAIPGQQRGRGLAG